MSTYCREALKGGALGSSGGTLGTTRRVGPAASVDGALAAGIRGGAR